MEIDHASQEYVLTPEEQQLFGISNPRVPFSNAQEVLAWRAARLEGNLSKAMEAPYDELYGAGVATTRRQHLLGEKFVVRSVMRGIELESQATLQIEADAQNVISNLEALLEQS